MIRVVQYCLSCVNQLAPSADRVTVFSLATADASVASATDRAIWRLQATEFFNPHFVVRSAG